MSMVLSILWFLLVHGTSTLVWTLLGSLAGLIGGMVLIWLVRLVLWRYRRRRAFTSGVIVVLLVITVLPLVTVAGGFFGGARAVRALVEQQAILTQAAELGFEGAERALSEAQRRMQQSPAEPEGVGEATREAEEISESARATVSETARGTEENADQSEEESAIAQQVELALRLVRGEERFPIDSLAELVGSFSDEALRRALAVYEGGHTKLGERGPLTWIARGLGQRLLTWLIEGPESLSQRWTLPVERDLGARPEHRDGLATGRELGLAIVRVHLQQPMAKWTYLAVAVQGWTLLAIAALCLVAIPAPLMLLARLVSPPAATQETETEPEVAQKA